MEINIYLLVFECLVLFIELVIIHGKAMIGKNIKVAQDGEYPFVVSIMTIEAGHPHSGGRYFCSGALISRRDVLTAEHCIESHDVNTVQVVVGTVNLKNGSVFYPLWWQSYDQWATANNIKIDFHLNDLANIRLREKVSSKLNPIKLSSLSNSDLYGANVTSAGWGDDNDGTPSFIMEVANLQILTNLECQRRIEKLSGDKFPIHNKMLCTAVKPHILISFGNSGGPLIFRNRLIAINLGTSPKLRAQFPHEKQVNIHIGTYSFKKFISYMKK